MSPRSSSIPIYRERCALQSIKYRGWVSAPALLPAGEATVANLIRKGWIDHQLGPGGQPQYRITDAGLSAIFAKIPIAPFAR